MSVAYRNIVCWLKKIIENIPLNMKEKFLYDLTSSFEYFQLLGFAPDAVHNSVVSENKTSSEIAKLKKLAEEISSELKKSENA